MIMKKLFSIWMREIGNARVMFVQQLLLKTTNVKKRI